MNRVQRAFIFTICVFVFACGGTPLTTVQTRNEDNTSTNEESVSTPHAIETWANANSVLWRSEDERELTLWRASTDWESVHSDNAPNPICLGQARMGEVVECAVPFTDCVHVLEVHREGAMLYVRERSAIGSACTSIESSLGDFARVDNAHPSAAAEFRGERPECQAFIPENAIHTDHALDGVWLGRTYRGGDGDMYQGMFSLAAKVLNGRLNVRLDTNRVVDWTECEGPVPDTTWSTLSCRLGADASSADVVPLAPRVGVRVVHGPHHDRMFVRMLDPQDGEASWRMGMISLVRIQPLLYTSRSHVCLESDDDIGDVLVHLGGDPDRIRAFIERELATRQRDVDFLGLIEASNIYMGIAYSALLMCGDANQTPRAQQLLAQIEETPRDDEQVRARLVDELSAAMAPCVDRTLARPNFFEEATHANFDP